MQAFETVFGSMHHVAWWQEVLRAVVIFVFGLAVLRISGRRTFARWSSLDLVVSIVFGSSLSRALTGSAPFGGTLAAMLALVALHWVLARASAQWPKVSKWFEGSPIELARGGADKPQTLIDWSVSRVDLEEALRGSGIQHLSQAQLIMLEPSGKITVVKQG